MNGVPRQHHILPVFYLAGFTDTGMSDGHLHVYDYWRNRRFYTSPAKVVKQRDFYKLELEPTETNAFEETLSKMESLFAPFLLKIRHRQKLSGRSELLDLLYFVSFIHVKGLTMRLRFQELLNHKLKQNLSVREFSGLEIEDGLLAGSRNPGILENRNDFLIYQLRRESIQGLHIENMWVAQDLLMEELRKRTWGFAKVSSDSSGFICSDNPFTFGTREPWQDPTNPGALTDPDSTLMFPLDKNLALISRSDFRSGTYLVPEEVVAWVNSRTHLFSLGRLFSPSENFLLLQSHMRMGRSIDYFEYVHRERDQA